MNARLFNASTCATPAAIARPVGHSWFSIGRLLAAGMAVAVACGFSTPLAANPLEPFNLDGLSIPRREIVSGGPGKDGIPSLTNPKTVVAKEAGFPPGSRVVAVTAGKETRGYPIAVLNWHEAVNDTIGDTPLVVVYCPLCDSVSVMDRRIGDRVLEFGISGLLHNSNVLLYDRTDNALWSQIGLTAVSGPHAGASLKHLPWELTTFADFAKRHPDAPVLSVDTGHRRDYGRNPYEAYFKTDRLMFPVARSDDRLKAKTPVVGVKLGEHVRAYPVEVIRRSADGRLADTLGESTIVLRASQDTVAVADAPEEAIIVHTFWFAWSAYHAGTSIYGTESDAHENGPRDENTP